MITRFEAGSYLGIGDYSPDRKTSGQPFGHSNLTFFLAGLSRTYFVFEKDFFEYHTWRDSIIIPAKNLRFFTFDSGLLTVYFVRENLVSVSKFIHGEKAVRENPAEMQLAVKTDGELFKLAVPSIGLYEHGERAVIFVLLAQ